MLALALLTLTYVASAQDVGTDDPSSITETTDSSPAATPDDDEDRTQGMKLFHNGKELYDEGNYTAAVSAWEKAYELTEEPQLMFNIASAYERIGEYQKAIDALNIFRALGDVEDKVSLERRLVNLERQRDESAQADAAQVAAVETAATDAGQPIPAKKGRRNAGFALIGAGGAGLVVGGVLAGMAGSASSQAQESCVGGLCLTDASTDIDRAKGLGIGADVAFVTGVAILGTGVALSVSSRARPASTVSVGFNSATFTTKF